MFVASHSEAEANSAKTMKANPTPRVTLGQQAFTYRVGLCSEPSGRLTLLKG